MFRMCRRPQRLLGPSRPRQLPSPRLQALGRLPWPGLKELPDLMARMQLNCLWMDSILCCLCTDSLLNSICDVKPRLITEKQIRFCKLNSLAFPPSQGVSPWPPLRAAILPSYLPTLLSQTLIITPIFTGDPPGWGVPEDLWDPAGEAPRGVLPLSPWAESDALGQLQAPFLCLPTWVLVGQAARGGVGSPLPASTLPSVQARAPGPAGCSLGRAPCPGLVPHPVASLIAMPGGPHSDFIWPCCSLKDTDEHGGWGSFLGS